MKKLELEGKVAIVTSAGRMVGLVQILSQKWVQMS